MPKTAAGLLLYRRRSLGVEVLLAHPGGPFWARKDLGAWTIPKGEIDPGEDPVSAARREFREEIGLDVTAPVEPLGQIKQPGGKIVLVWTAEGDFDPARLASNTFEMEWPKGSGHMRIFPEVDRAAWFDLGEARRRILPGQAPFLEALVASLDNRHST
ncbi:MAG TPA: NUDIX domain-containing protein [Gemmatimonadales bacterium]|jgi:predicted NUDIX family NTP pyrophosphohydrolase|nr:NUDIX domain-containing protein [Gemmatimonadales bacterium]